MLLFHTVSALSVAFDDPNLVSSAGLVPVLALASRCGLHESARSSLRVPNPNAAAKVVAGMVAGADSIDDPDRLRQGGMSRLFGRIRAPSTLGTFLSAFSFGHVKQLDKPPPNCWSTCLGTPRHCGMSTGCAGWMSMIRALFDGERAFMTDRGAELRERAVLVPDPDNPYGDGHAVAIYVLGRHVGYVPHGLSTEYFPPVAAMTSQGAAVTVDARIWASSNHRDTRFLARVSLMVARASEFIPPSTMPDVSNVVLLPVGNALQVTGEEEHLAFLSPYVGQTVAVTRHTVVVTKAGQQSTRVEVQLERNAIGRLTPATSAKVGPLVEQVEHGGGLPVARAVVRGNSLKADVTIYVARAGEVDQNWLDAPRHVH